MLIYERGLVTVQRGAHIASIFCASNFFFFMRCSFVYYFCSFVSQWEPFALPTQLPPSVDNMRSMTMHGDADMFY